MYKIDSLRLTLDFDKITIISPYLETCVLISNSGEVLETEFRNNSFKVENKGFRTYYAITENYDFKTRQNIKKFILMFSAKILEHDYLKGITNDTIKKCYSSIIEQKIIHVNFDDFLNGICTDFDICKDYILNDEPFTQFCKKTLEYMKECDKLARGYKIFSKDDNRGLQLSSRDTQDYKKHPFVKWYSKGKELNSKKNAEFYNTVIQNMNVIEGLQFAKAIQNLRRCELTVKNAKHFKIVTGSDKQNTLKNVLLSDLESVFHVVLSSYFDTQKTIRYKAETEGKDKIIVLLINLLRSSGRNTDDIINYVISNFEGMKKSRVKKLLNNLSKVEVNTDKYEATFENFLNCLKQDISLL